MKLPGAAVTSHTADDAFQRVADRINASVRKTVAAELRHLSKFGELPDDGAGFGPTVVAAVAGMINAAGYLTESYEPFVHGDVLAGVVAGQFNDGREDWRRHHSGTIQ